jgi:hypothetical protein
VTVAIGVVTVAVGTVGVVTVTAVTGVLMVTVTGAVGTGTAGNETLGTCAGSDVVAWAVEAGDEAGDDAVVGPPLAARRFDARTALVLDPPAATE